MFSENYLRFKYLVEENLIGLLPKVDSAGSTLYEAMKYSLSAGGKRIRPVLLLASCELCGENPNKAVPFACAAEYIQTYSLIHDDLPAMDDDDLRRGKPTNHKVFGEGMAILAGDGLLSASYELMTKDMLLYLDDEIQLKRRAKAAFEITKGTGCRGMVAGQAADLEAEHKECTSQILSYIHMNKTAAFIKSSVLTGAYLGGAGKKLFSELAEYGECLGLAFQIVDDIMDVTSTPEERGKAVGGDAEAEKATYPALYGLDESAEKAHMLIEKARKTIETYGSAAAVLLEVLGYLEDQISK